MDIFDYDDMEFRDDYHDVVTLQLRELIENGWFNLEDKSWDFPKYSDEQHKLLCEKITMHYYTREISITPPAAWKMEFLRTMYEIMPKYIPLYKILDESPQLLGAESDYYKARNIYSDFPQTQLNGKNGDYASSGNDTEYERIRQLNIMDIAERIKGYDDVDKLIINEIEGLFSCLFTVNINGY